MCLYVYVLSEKIARDVTAAFFLTGYLSVCSKLIKVNK